MISLDYIAVFSDVSMVTPMESLQVFRKKQNIPMHF